MTNSFDIQTVFFPNCSFAICAPFRLLFAAEQKNCRYNKGERETPLEIMETEHQVAQFLKKGVNMITREGKMNNIRMVIFQVKTKLDCSPNKILQETS